MKRNKWFLLGIVLSLLFVFSCEKEEESNSTKAVFSYIPDGFKVSFTNFSTNAKEYSWDFGDESEGSTLKSPVHVFPSKGQFLVTLVANNLEATSTFKDTVLIIGPNIKIDGDFTDWAYVAYTSENPEGATMTAVKTYASAGYLNFYIEGTEDFNLAVFDMFLDTDNNPETGFKTGSYPAGAGGDFLFEGSVPGEWGDIYEHVGPDNDWNWNAVASFPDMMVFSAMKNNNGRKAIEFSIKRDGLGTLSKFVNFGILENDEGWSQIGAIPLDQTDESKFAQIVL